MDKSEMVTKLNGLQHRLKVSRDIVERERLQLSIDKLTAALKRSVREHNKQLERR